MVLRFRLEEFEVVCPEPLEIFRPAPLLFGLGLPAGLLRFVLPPFLFEGEDFLPITLGLYVFGGRCFFSLLFGDFQPLALCLTKHHL